MNKHFEDSLYYLKRAGQHAKQGVAEELEPVENRVRDITGMEEEPEPTRIEKVREDLTTLERRAEDEARKAVGEARSLLA